MGIELTGPNPRFGGGTHLPSAGTGRTAPRLAVCAAAGQNAPSNPGLLEMFHGI